MKEIPILMSTPMVQAILAGRKTQTRRIIKSNHESGMFAVGRSIQTGQITEITSVDWDECPGDVTNDIRPRWKVGDWLWVRESYQIQSWCLEDGEMTVRFATGDTLRCYYPGAGEDDTWIGNQIDRLVSGKYFKEDPDNEEYYIPTGKKQPFKPSIHMPKDAARIWLEVTDIKVERVQDISEEDAKNEGVEALGLYPGYDISARGKFEGLWNMINGNESWDENPWVWVVSFKELSRTGKPATID